MRRLVIDTDIYIDWFNAGRHDDVDGDGLPDLLIGWVISHGRGWPTIPPTV